MSLENFLAGTADFVDRLDKYADSSTNLVKEAEHREIAEQFYIDLLEPSMKMQGLKSAGINPLTAARGLSGSQSSTPSSNGLDPLQIVGEAAAAASNVATGASNMVNAGTNATKLPYEIELLNNQAKSEFEKAGLTNAQTQGVLSDNTYKDEDWKSRLNVQRQNFENMKEEFKVIKKNHDLIAEQIKETISQTELNGSLKDYNDQLALQIQEQTRWMKEQNEFRLQHKLFINESGIDGYIWSMVLSDSDISRFDNFIDIYSRFRGSVSTSVAEGEFSTQKKYAFDIANAQETARSLNSIITDWNAPASGLWSLLEKSFNISGNRDSKNNIGSAISAKANPDVYSGYCQFMVGLNLSLEELNNQIEAAKNRNEFGKIRDLSRQKSGLEKFIRELSFEQYKKYVQKSE